MIACIGGTSDELIYAQSGQHIHTFPCNQAIGSETRAQVDAIAIDRLTGDTRNGNSLGCNGVRTHSLEQFITRLTLRQCHTQVFQTNIGTAQHLETHTFAGGRSR